MEILIRAETNEDHADIARVNRLAFGRDAEPELIERIRQGEGFEPALSLVAVRDNEVVGHILFSPIQIQTARESESDGAPIPALALAPMAVLPEYQRKGIGSALVRAGLDACRRSGHAIVIVVGHPPFYARFGFERTSKYGIRVPFDAPAEAVRVLFLSQPPDFAQLKGVVRYPPAFDGI